MAGLVPAMNVLLSLRDNKSWMPRARPGMTELE